MILILLTGKSGKQFYPLTKPRILPRAHRVHHYGRGCWEAGFNFDMILERYDELAE
jgi:hypothetical protein